ncbi:MAG TPA: sugar transferase [Roseiflexaceae bacterium]|nr:sugar transferase [Roseiflexaceae bacterium]
MAKLTDIVPARTPAHGPAAPALRRSALGHMMEPLVDAALILVGFAAAYGMRYLVRWPPPLDSIVREVLTQNFVPITAFLPIALLLMVLLLAQFAAKGLYRMPRAAGLLDHTGIIISSTTGAIALLIVVVFIFRPFYYSRLIFAFAWIVIILLLCAWRALLISVRRWRWTRGIGRERILVVGGTGLGRHVMEGIVAHPFLGYALAGYLDDRPPAQAPEHLNQHFRHVGRIRELEAVLRGGGIDQVIIALPFWEHQRLPELVSACRAAGVEFRVAPDLYELSFDRVDVGELVGIPLIGLKQLSLQGWNLVVKRTMDLALVALALPLVLPLSLLIALAIRCDSPGPVIFRQQRVGKHGRRFTCYKFRTMVADAEERKAELQALNEADGPLFKIRNDPRTTAVGRFLRRYSLDELPQLWNILRGEMSWVGPRPATPAEVEQFQEWHHRRFEVTPGLTGLSQVLGRSDISFDEMVRLDIFYAEHWSPAMDVRILLQTVPAVLYGKGAY